MCNLSVPKLLNVDGWFVASIIWFWHFEFLDDNDKGGINQKLIYVVCVRCMYIVTCYYDFYVIKMFWCNDVYKIKKYSPQFLPKNLKRRHFPNDHKRYTTKEHKFNLCRILEWGRNIMPKVKCFDSPHIMKSLKIDNRLSSLQFEFLVEI